MISRMPQCVFERLCEVALTSDHHLLMNHENYQEPKVKKTKPKIPSSVLPIRMMDIDEMIKIMSQAGYLVEKDLKEGCG